MDAGRRGQQFNRVVTPTALTFLSAVSLVPVGAKAGTGTTYVAADLYTLPVPAGYGSFGTNGFGQQAVGGQVAGTLYVTGGTVVTHAFIATAGVGRTAAYTDLNPAADQSSVGLGTNGGNQVGYGTGADGYHHALLWSGSAASAVDLNPTALGFNSSAAQAVNAGQQVGEGVGPNGTQALLWAGSAASAVVLGPAGMTYSIAYDADGVHQVGNGSGPATGNAAHALLWSGTAGSAIDLNPTAAGVGGSGAYGVGGGQEVGYETLTGGSRQAVVWSGSAGSAVDLNPAGFISSVAYATNGSVQVGSGQSFPGSLKARAMVWSGTAASAVDLSAALPADYTASYAWSVDPTGNIFGTATDAAGVLHAVEWSPAAVPEPAATSACAAVLSAMLTRRQRRGR